MRPGVPPSRLHCRTVDALRDGITALPALRARARSVTVRWVLREVRRAMDQSDHSIVVSAIHNFGLYETKPIISPMGHQPGSPVIDETDDQGPGVFLKKPLP